MVARLVDVDPMLRLLKTGPNRLRFGVIAAVMAAAGLGWFTGTLAGEDATEDSLLPATSIVRVVAAGPTSCGVEEKMVSVEAVQLGETTDPSSYPILGLQGWSFVLHYDPSVLRFTRDAGSVSIPVGSESRAWTIWPAEVDARRGTVSIHVSSEPRKGDLPRAGAIRPETDRALTLGSVVFAPIAGGYSRIWIDDVVLTPVGASTPLLSPSTTDGVVAASCA